MMKKIIFNVIGKKTNQTSDSDADRKIPTLRSMDNAGNLFPALFVYPRVGISLSASKTEDRFYLSLLRVLIWNTQCGVQIFREDMI